MLAVDHFGKMVETGTRGTSAKEAAADVVLALLADRKINGTISNMPWQCASCAAVRSASRRRSIWRRGRCRRRADDLRGSMEGDPSCGAGPQPAKDRWPKALRIFKTAMETAVIEHGKAMRPYGSEAPESGCCGVCRASFRRGRGRGWCRTSRWPRPC